MPKKRGLQNLVLDILQETPGLSYSTTAIEQAVKDKWNGDGPFPWGRQAVSGALSTLHNKAGVGVQRVSQGRYVFRPNAQPAPTGRLFETVGQVEGTAVVRDEDGKLFALMPIQLGGGE